MSTKMKGLLKGLRYISQMFDGDDKEPEIQIGFPTDVKHVAHIGWDGSSVSSPSWVNADILAMNEYKGPKQALPDMLNTSTVEAQENSSKSRKDKAKSSTKHHHQPVNSSSPVNSPSRRSKHNRSLMDSPTKGSPGRTSTRQSKKHQNSSLGNVVAASPDTQVVSSPKKSRRRKSKGGSGSGSGQGVSVTTSEEKKERD